MAENPKVAVSAVVVAGVVGLGGPALTLVVTGKQEEKRRTHDTVMADRQELRKVLDDAMLELRRSNGEFRELVGDWGGGAVRASVVRQRSQHVLDALERSYTRLLLRLDEDSEVSTAYARAIARARRMHGLFAVEGRPLVRDVVEERAGALSDATTATVRAARGLAGAKLNEPG